MVSYCNAEVLLDTLFFYPIFLGKTGFFPTTNRILPSGSGESNPVAGKLQFTDREYVYARLAARIYYGL